jgi:peptidoglycan/xylan/chitin deacetylase (PgdA/CDA1 family)
VRRITVLAAGAAVVVAVAAAGFTIGRAGRVHEPVAKAVRAKVADVELTTGTIPSKPSPTPTISQSPPAAPRALADSPAGSRSFPAPERTDIATTAGPACPTNPGALGVSRVVEIDTTGGPGFGFEQFKAHDFLEAGEIVLTFDDGPWPAHTPAVLAALAAHCVKATFFPIGKHATWHPEILKQVAAAGHAVGSHTWSHLDLSKKSVQEAKDEIEKGFSAVRWAIGAPGAPYFRFPALKHPPELVTYLGQRNIAIFSTDMDSFDFKLKKPDQVVSAVLAKLKKFGKGMILMHDFQRVTADAMPALLAQLKTNGYKIVFIMPKGPVQTVAPYDESVMKDQKLPTVSDRPTSSVVVTISE